MTRAQIIETILAALDGLTDRQLELLYKWLKVLTTDP